MKEVNYNESRHLIASGHYGIYIPQFFAESLNFDEDKGVYTYGNMTVEGITPEDVDSLLDQLREDYWDTWDDVMNNVTISGNGREYYLLQDDDLWLVDVNEGKVELSFMNERGEYSCHLCCAVTGEELWKAGTEDIRQLIEDGFIPYVPHECAEELLCYLQESGVISDDFNTIEVI
jgi:hypothetical protein